MQGRHYLLKDHKVGKTIQPLPRRELHNIRIGDLPTTDVHENMTLRQREKAPAVQQDMDVDDPSVSTPHQPAATTHGPAPTQHSEYVPSSVAEVPSSLRDILGQHRLDEVKKILKEVELSKKRARRVPPGPRLRLHMPSLDRYNVKPFDIDKALSSIDFSINGLALLDADAAPHLHAYINRLMQVSTRENRAKA